MQKLPAKGTPEAKEFCGKWDLASAPDKLRLCEQYGAAYKTGKNFRAINRALSFKPSYRQPIDVSWEERLDIFKKMDKLVAFHQFTPSEISLEIKTNKPIGIVSTADWQLGEPGCDYDSFQRDIETICEADGLYADVGGDTYENLIQASKMGSSMNQIPVAPQKALVVQTLKKLNPVRVINGVIIIRADTHLLALRTGNHNYWTCNADGEDWERELCNRLNVIYSKHGGMLNLKVGDFVYPILRLHKGNFNSSFNQTHSNRQTQRTQFPQARVVVVEHKHIAEMLQYRYADQECVAIRPGTYGVYSDFAQQNSFFGAHVANPTTIFWPNEDRLVGFKDMREAIIYLKAVRG